MMRARGVHLTDPDVPIDSNHLERVLHAIPVLRAIPMGRKVWLFLWTELGAKYVFDPCAGVSSFQSRVLRLHHRDRQQASMPPAWAPRGQALAAAGGATRTGCSR
jgi:Transposase IS66 family